MTGDELMRTVVVIAMLSFLWCGPALTLVRAVSKCRGRNRKGDVPFEVEL